MDAAAMNTLNMLVLARYAEELEEAAGDDRQFEHLAARAEGLYGTPMGQRMRGLADEARARRVITASLVRLEAVANHG
jgi:hypothetical protein